MQGEFNNIKISGCAAVVPNYRMDNDRFSDVIGERRVKKQIKLTGIKNHYLTTEWQKASDLGIEAARRILNHLKWNTEEIKVLIYITQMADYRIPSTAMDLANRLGLRPDCLAYDVNLGCSGFDIGLQTVASLLQSQNENAKGLLIVAEKTDKPDMINFNPDNISGMMMFGAGGACAAIEKRANSQIIFENLCYGEKYDYILSYKNTPTRMDGLGVYNFANEEVSACISKFLNDHVPNKEVITGYLMHQAQKTLVDTVADNCKLEKEKVFISYDEYGNTSSASIPITLCHIFGDKTESKSLRFISCGFGVGLSLGISLWEIDQANVLPISETDYHYDEHIKHKSFLYDRAALVVNTGDDLLDTISRQLDFYGCHVDSIGDDEYLTKLYEGMFYKDYHIFHSVEEAGEFGKTYDSIIFNLDKGSEIEITERIRQFADTGVLNSTSRVFLVFDHTKKDREQAQKLIDDLAKEFTISVCGVGYCADDIDTYPLIYGKMDWYERGLFDGKSDKMANAIKLGYPIVDMTRKRNDRIKTAMICL